jgi:hypothetical protein
MKKLALFALTLLCISPLSWADSDYSIKKVDVQFIQSPDYQVSPAPRQSRPEKWMEIEVTFDAGPEFTDELTFNYYVLFAGRLFVGKVDHVSIPKGRERRSVAYISPRSIMQILESKPLTAADIGNVSVTITRPGVSAPLDAKSWRPSNGEWWASLKQEEGFVVNKSQTPFAPLYWDRYESLKPSSLR